MKNIKKEKKKEEWEEKESDLEDFALRLKLIPGHLGFFAKKLFLIEAVFQLCNLGFQSFLGLEKEQERERERAN